ncbi:MAG: AraC family transcriptional regulator [Ferruginibacter sp.]|nr:helix-turn-helix transcriptional regulator [Ferruginibacter sp.]
MSTTENDILTLAQKQPFLYNELELLFATDKSVPGSIQYSIKRYKRLPQWSVDDMGVLEYIFEKNNPAQNKLNLKFCVSGNVYCKQKQTECNNCNLNGVASCSEKVDSIDILEFSFTPSYLQQFAKATKTNNTLTEQVFSFTHTNSFSKTLPLCSKTRMAIESLLNHTYSDTLANIFVNAQMQILLLYSSDCMLGHKLETTFACKFLANEDDRQKIINAREILLQHIGEPITIKALSRKVAINECYLKKGFKEIFGTTIFDFYQSQRMEHAKYLLYEKGLSVTNVSDLLGYSSISHFSTAFKKQTGIKPCELLLR